MKCALYAPFGDGAMCSDVGGKGRGTCRLGGIAFSPRLRPGRSMNDWPRGDGKYLPMESAEFQRLLGLSESACPKIGVPLFPE